MIYSRTKKIYNVDTRKQTKICKERSSNGKQREF